MSSHKQGLQTLIPPLESDRAEPMPERELLAAILLQAVVDAKGRAYKLKHVKAEAIHWLQLERDRPEDDDSAFSFVFICEALNLCAVRVHKAIKGMADNLNYRGRPRKGSSKTLGSLLSIY